MTNAERRERAAKALSLYDEPLVRDLLADLMHYCKARRIDFDTELDSGRGHFEAEGMVD